MINIQIALEQEQIANYVDETPVNILDSSRFANGIQTALKTIQKGKLHIIWLRNIQAFQFFFFIKILLILYKTKHGELSRNV